MTASSRPLPPSSPLEDDNMLREILIRLPADPSSLPRASSVSKRWNHIVTDPRFRRRFRLLHGSNPPLLGFFNGSGDLSFLPTLEAPNRVAHERLSLQLGDGDRYRRPLGCRHGLFLVLLPKTPEAQPQLLVWDPLTGDQHRFDVPPGFATNDSDKSLINGAVLRRSAEDTQHFQVVLVVADGDGVQHRRVDACVYTSETGVWGSFISAPIPYDADGSSLFPLFSTIVHTDHSVLAGNSLYWLLIGNIEGILEFDLDNQRLAVIQVPVSIYSQGNCFKVMRADDGGGLGFLFMAKDNNYAAQLWRRKTDSSDGVASWVVGRTIEVDKLLSLNSCDEKEDIRILGYAEHNNVVLLHMSSGIFIIQLDSLQFKKLSGTNRFATLNHAFESLFVTERSISGGNDGADLSHNT